ncbi:MAG: hypothetical protein QF473_28385, partial [Planctomycetota bacterium]|nr:hypothetical protein [Planctomycetota bacterium]
MNYIVLIAVTFPCLIQSATSQGLLLVDENFDNLPAGESPRGWNSFWQGRPKVIVSEPGVEGEGRCLKAVRSNSSGWVSLSRSFEPQERILIEFSFAFSVGKGRTLNVWSHEPEGKDASQFNLAIQRGALQQYDGRTRTWETITPSVKPSAHADRPVWHRLRAIVDANRPGIDYWISGPGSRELPAKPVATAHAYRAGLKIAAIDFVSGTRITQNGWYLIDDFVIRGGTEIPEPGKVKPMPKPYKLWCGPPIPSDLSKILFVEGVEHSTIHQAKRDG